MTAYYNEHDPYAAQWLRNLISAGHIAPGDVDERSIEDVRPDDIRGYTQAHFFAGIGVWSAALRGVGWPDNRPIWTGSCPCQPFSAAGKGGGLDDERHLWPDFFHLITQCRPPVIVGEQVASKDGLAWLDLVQSDMEGTGHAFGAVDLCAAGVGAPHIRQRLWFVAERLADAKLPAQPRQRLVGGEALREQVADGSAGGGVAVGLDRDAGNPRLFQEQGVAAGIGLADMHVDGRDQGRPSEPAPRHDGAVGDGADGGVADAADIGRIGRRSSETSIEPGSVERSARLRAAPTGLPTAGPTNGLWRDADWLFCRDGKWRPVEPGTFPLAHGAAGRVGRLRAYGNAIVLAQAEAFLDATVISQLECTDAN